LIPGLAARRDRKLPPRTGAKPRGAKARGQNPASRVSGTQPPRKRGPMPYGGLT
jgi:hypothetical protein